MSYSEAEVFVSWFVFLGGFGHLKFSGGYIRGGKGWSTTTGEEDFPDVACRGSSIHLRTSIRLELRNDGV